MIFTQRLGGAEHAEVCCDFEEAEVFKFFEWWVAFLEHRNFTTCGVDY
jgi:hypothetical protein